MTDLVTEYKNFDSVSEIMGSLTERVSSLLAELASFRPVEALAPDAYALKAIELAAAVREQADHLTRIAVEFSSKEYRISARKLAEAAAVSNSTASRWLASPYEFDAEAADIEDYEARRAKIRGPREPDDYEP